MWGNALEETQSLGRPMGSVLGYYIKIQILARTMGDTLFNQKATSLCPGKAFYHEHQQKKTVIKTLRGCFQPDLNYLIFKGTSLERPSTHRHERLTVTNYNSGSVLRKYR